MGLRNVPVFCLIVLFCSSSVLGEEPSVSSLIEVMPLLSPRSDGLQSFKATVSMPQVMDDFVAAMAWHRKGHSGLCISTGSGNVPCWFVSQRRGFIFDAAAARLTLINEAHPKFILAAQDEALEFRYGIHEEASDDTIFNLDVASFMNSATDHRVSESPDGMWKLFATSKSGKAVVVAKFSKSNVPVLKSLVVRSAESEKLVLVEVRDIVVNDKKRVVWPSFPENDAFPKSLDVRELDTADGLGLLMRTLACQVALTDEKQRARVAPLGIDWSSARKTYNSEGQQLRRMVVAESPKRRFKR